MLRATLLALSLAFSAPQVSADAYDDAVSAHYRGDLGREDFQKAGRATKCLRSSFTWHHVRRRPRLA